MIADLPDSIYAQVEKLSLRGNDSLDEKGDWKGAVRVWKQALGLLPKPDTDWEAGCWLHTSIGEAYIEGEDTDSAMIHFNFALQSVGGIENPLIQYRIGQILFDDGDIDSAKDYLLRAYMLDGAEIFKDDGEEYLKLLRDNKLVD